MSKLDLNQKLCLYQAQKYNMLTHKINNCLYKLKSEYWRSSTIYIFIKMGFLGVQNS